MSEDKQLKDNFSPYTRLVTLCRQLCAVNIRLLQNMEDIKQITEALGSFILDPEIEEKLKK